MSRSGRIWGAAHCWNRYPQFQTLFAVPCPPLRPVASVPSPAPSYEKRVSSLLLENQDHLIVTPCLCRGCQEAWSAVLCCGGGRLPQPDVSGKNICLPTLVFDSCVFYSCFRGLGIYCLFVHGRGPKPGLETGRSVLCQQCGLAGGQDLTARGSRRLAGAHATSSRGSTRERDLGSPCSSLWGSLSSCASPSAPPGPGGGF